MKRSLSIVTWICLCLKVLEIQSEAILGGAPENEDGRELHMHPFTIEQNAETECHSEEETAYRTPNGVCNNAFNLGSTNTPLRRMLPAEYDNKYGAPRRYGTYGGELPSAVDVSRLLHYDEDRFGARTVMFMQFGQFIDHEIVLSPIPAPKEGSLHCCTKERDFVESPEDVECLPIHVKDDRFYGQCMEFTRSIPLYTESAYGRRKISVPREQINVVTSFLDGSAIYGSSEETLEHLRDQESRALLKLSSNNLLPEDPEGGEGCFPREGDWCFLAGDVRVNEQPGLGVIHTLWVRLHNRVAKQLTHVRPNDDPDRVFQLARKIVVAIQQNILYSEWLPKVLGDEVMRAYRLSTGDRVAYSTSVNPSVINAFAGSAFRFGHTLIPRGYNVSGVFFPLRKLFRRPDLLFDNFNGMVEALVASKSDAMHAQQIDTHLVSEVTSHLFEPHDQDPHGPSLGLDLAALNIQRGRDHGLPPFNKYRKVCGLPEIESFSEFGPEYEDKLRQVYNSVDDIDLFTGGLLEAPAREGILGPTFGCIIATQFNALKYGDRFFFETTREEEGFNDDQLNALRRVTLAKFLCFFPDNREFRNRKSGVLRQIQRDAFSVPSDQNKLIPCRKLRRTFLDFSLWAED